MDLVTLTFSQTASYLNLFDLMIIKWNICIHYNQNVQSHPFTKKNNSLYILFKNINTKLDINKNVIYIKTHK